MKLAIASLVLATTSSTRLPRSVDGNNDRRYKQLTQMMRYFNPDFDERKYWTYGCNCLILGDRPMSDPGHGPPVDALDSVCKAYKDCLKCARKEHGDQCIPEFVRYRYGLKNGNAVCRDSAGSCERSLCECDAMFAEQHVAEKDVFTEKYHMFWAEGAGYSFWDPQDGQSCQPHGTVPVEPTCCQAETQDGPFRLYNRLTKKCCSDGRIVLENQDC